MFTFSARIARAAFRVASVPQCRSVPLQAIADEIHHLPRIGVVYRGRHPSEPALPRGKQHRPVRQTEIPSSDLKMSAVKDFSGKFTPRPVPVLKHRFHAGKFFRRHCALETAMAFDANRPFPDSLMKREKTLRPPPHSAPEQGKQTLFQPPKTPLHTIFFLSGSQIIISSCECHFNHRRSFSSEFFSTPILMHAPPHDPASCLTSGPTSGQTSSPASCLSGTIRGPPAYLPGKIFY